MKSVSVLVKVLRRPSQSESYSDRLRYRVSQHPRKSERLSWNHSQNVSVSEEIRYTVDNM